MFVLLNVKKQVGKLVHIINLLKELYFKLTSHIYVIMHSLPFVTTRQITWCMSKVYRTALHGQLHWWISCFILCTSPSLYSFFSVPGLGPDVLLLDLNVHKSVLPVRTSAIVVLMLVFISSPRGSSLQSWFKCFLNPLNFGRVFFSNLHVLDNVNVRI